MLSHNHWDHIDGLRDLRKINSETEIVHPDDFSEPTEISADISTTDALGVLPKEQSLVIKTEKGNIVVTGCAHPGLERILRVAGTFGRVYGVLGGFHVFLKFAELEGIQLIAPCHCIQHTKQIKQMFLSQFKQIQAGSVIEI